MRVEQVGQAEGDSALVVFSSDRYLSQTTLLRQQTAELIFEQLLRPAHPQGGPAHGHPEPNRSRRPARTSRTTWLGVYTLVGGRAEFKPVEILTEGADYYVVSPATEERAVLRAGDEVIVRATGLYDGKLLNF